MADRELWTVALGRMGYAESLELQRNIARDRISGAIPQDVLLLVEHPNVVTLGRAAKEKHLVASPEFLQSKGIEVFEVERGGDVTYHGPGQLVGYPIIDLKRHRQDLHWYLRKIEEALINALADYGIPAERDTAYTGVWTRGRKIASIGVHARDWVTWHGFALNVTTDLSFFDLIVPCGIDGVVMTSIAREIGAADVPIQDVRDRITAAFAAAFDLTAVVTSRSALLETVA
ncbi:MAG TPA: lipoyl(octanoyl) transferase LipB [Gemmatimonadaceae bacterium]|jgi:lipoate-protein ligase B|nr:lipoyl(octanoyl) transferase LipB [Gemmatimonadaceae bacterium]